MAFIRLQRNPDSPSTPLTFGKCPEELTNEICQKAKGGYIWPGDPDASLNN